MKWTLDKTKWWQADNQKQTEWETQTGRQTDRHTWATPWHGQAGSLGQRWSSRPCDGSLWRQRPCRSSWGETGHAQSERVPLHPTLSSAAATRTHAHTNAANHTAVWDISRNQWHSKALRGPGSTVTWGPSLSLPSISPSIPFPSPFPPLLQPSPSPCRRAAPANPARGSGRAPAEVEFGAFYALCSLLLVFSK